MAFRIPTFNLTCNLWRAQVYPPVGAPTLTPACQLRMIKESAVESTIFGAGMEEVLCLPAHTDIRANTFAGALDLVECPAASGRFYVVVGVADVAKGFPNEYRIAILQQDHSAALSWPYPTP